MMEIIEKRAIIMSVRDRWKEQYSHYKSDSQLGWTNGTKSKVEAELDALDLTTCSEQAVDAAIGRAGWAENVCDECGKDFEKVIRFGCAPGYDSRWQDICQGCLEKALKKLKK